MNQQSRKVTLQFSNLRLLFRFSHCLVSNYLEINKTKITLTCTCSEQEIAVAKEQYAASLIGQTEPVDYTINHSNN